MSTPGEASRTIRSKAYVRLLLLAAAIGVPISVVAYFFLYVVSKLQHLVFTRLPRGLGFHGPPVWWPIPLLAVAGVLVAATIKYLPGHGGHSPADGFHAGGAPSPSDLPGVFLAALTTLVLGAVLGPEAPLIAIGGGLAICVVRLSRRPVPARAEQVVAASGSFAAIATLLGSPLIGAVLMMEAIGLGGTALELVLLPGLLAAGIGALIFTGLDAWTGLGTFSLKIPNVPHVGRPTISEFGWAIVIGLAAALFGIGIRRLARPIRRRVERRMLLLTPVVGVAVGGLAVAYAEGSGRSGTEVLFSGQSALPGLVQHAGTYSVGVLLLLLACKGLGYSLSLSSFRGGPVFPSMFLGAAGGIAMSHLPGLTMVAGTAMGIGAMCAVMLQLPVTAVLLATLLFFADGLAVMPLVIVAVAVAYVSSSWLSPQPP
ncbi:MAG TPA: chloride channel protein [Streptosporangiaceae bacterium]|nr:chloride channel protein [Streptosporangiaceae bacterium]